MRMMLDHWFVGNDDISISLMRFHVRIRINTIDDRLYYSLTITNSDMKELNLVFYSLVEAVDFTENKISKCCDFAQVLELYKETIINRNNQSRLSK